MRLVPLDQKHIDNGSINDCSDCPVALALIDAGYDPIVGSKQIGLHRGVSYQRCVSYDLGRWIDEFDEPPDDRCHGPEPMTLVVTDTEVAPR